MEAFYINGIKKIVEYIKRDPLAGIRLEALSEASGLSRFHLQRIFEAYTGISLYETITRLQIEKAASVLAENAHITLSEVAKSSGFKNYNEFKREFAKRFQSSPSAFRADVKNLSTPELQKIINDYPLFSSVNNSSIGRKLMNKEVRPVENFQIAYIRHSGAYDCDSSLFIYLYNKLTSWAASQDLLSPEFENVVVYHSPRNCSEDTNVKISIGITLPESIETGGDIGRMPLGGTDCLICRFSLKEQEYSDAWSYIYRKILPEHNLIPKDSFSFELYPAKVKSNDRTRNIVDIYIPVKEA